jgi:hypothetical protein
MRPILPKPTPVKPQVTHRPRQQHQVVAVHDLPLVRRPELAPQHRGGPADQRGDLVGVEVDQPPGDRDPVGTGQVHRVTGGERPGRAGQSGREQRRAALGDGPDRSVVEEQDPLGLGRVGQPKLPGRPAPGGGMEEGADGLPRQGLVDVVRRCEHDGDAGAGGDPSRVELGPHAAGADPAPTGSAEPDPAQVVGERNLGDQVAASLGRRSVVQSVDVAEQDQQVGVDEVRDERREPVVVPEPDLAGGDGVVLVDDRQDAELEQLGEGLVGVAVVAAARDVIHGEEDLPGDDPVSGQLLGVPVDQQPLADGGRRLLDR